MVRTEVVPGLEALSDPAADRAQLLTAADRQARRLRAVLEGLPDQRDRARFEPSAPSLRAGEAEWVRGHLHDTALQILEFIAGDGFGTGLSAKQIAGLAGRAASDLRRWIDLQSEAAGNLLAELESVAIEARSLHPNVELEVGELSRVPTGEQASALAGAVREALTNARKHAHASRIVVRVESAEDGHTAVTVTDNGVGFDPDRIRRAPGLGVQGSIVGRMERVGGHATLAPAPGGGTRVRLVTPTEEAQS